MVRTDKYLGFFTYYGQTHAQDRIVGLYRNENGMWVVEVEGYPELTKRVATFPEAKKVLEGYYDMSYKDYGASEITWKGAVTDLPEKIMSGRVLLEHPPDLQKDRFHPDFRELEK